MKEISLSQGKVALVDDGDFDWLNQWKWSASKTGKLRVQYRAVRVLWNGGKQKAVLMHRLIAGATDEQVVDHINGNALDNRRENLRVCTQAENSLNNRGTIRRWSAKHSRFKGVYWHAGGNKWMASFRKQYLGLFTDEEAAAAAYDQAARNYNPEFTRLNFPAAGGDPCPR